MILNFLSDYSGKIVWLKDLISFPHGFLVVPLLSKQFLDLASFERVKKWIHTYLPILPPCNINTTQKSSQKYKLKKLKHKIHKWQHHSTNLSIMYLLQTILYFAMSLHSFIHCLLFFKLLNLFFSGSYQLHLTVIFSDCPFFWTHSFSSHKCLI